MTMTLTELERMFRLDDKVFVVAGAGQGIGEETVRMLRALGARAVCVDRDEAKASVVAEANDGVAASGDVTSEADVVRFLDLADSTFGRLDGVIDIVGGARFVRIPELDAAGWDSQFDTNLRHAFYFGKHGGMRLAEREGGSMVFVTSIAAMFGSRAHPAYSAAKLALVSLVRSFAEEFGPSGVRCNSVAPGATLTPRMRDSWTEDALREMADPTMRRELGKTEEIAATIAFLASPASGNVTGQTLLADGGASSRDPVYGGGDNPGEADIRARQEAQAAAGLPWP